MKKEKFDIETLPIKDVVGQLFMVAFSGTEPRVARTIIDHCRVGGFYLSDDNFTNPVQALKLCTTLQTYARNSGLPPLMLAVDQEGAWGILTKYLVAGPGNMALGATWSEEHVYRMYKVFGKELQTIGLNTNLAPVADVITNPTNSIIGVRSFGEDPALVARLVSAAVKGLREAGMVGCLKHFPGHGATSFDSHRGLAFDHRALNALRETDLVSFRAGIEAGVEMVMAAHLVCPALDDKPATLSSRILRELLREELKFEGVILTDSFNMGAITKLYDPAEAAVQALDAGADMILMAEERYGVESGDYLANQMRIIHRVIKAVHNGELSEDRVREAAARVLQLKSKFNFVQDNGFSSPGRVVGIPEHREIELQAALDAITVLWGSNLLPLSLESSRSLIAIVRAVPPNVFHRLTQTRGIGPNVVESPAQALAEVLQARGFSVRLFDAFQESADKVSEKILQEALQAEVVVFTTEKYPLPGFDFEETIQWKALEWLLNHRPSDGFPPVIVVGFRDPFECSQLPEADAYLAAYGYRRASAEAVAKVLLGEHPPKGRLPVSVPGRFAVGYTANDRGCD